MALTKEDLLKIKDVVLEAMEPMMVASQKEFDKIGEQITDMDRSNTKAHEDMALRLDNVAYRFELVELKKRVEVLEKKATVSV